MGKLLIAAISILATASIVRAVEVAATVPIHYECRVEGNKLVVETNAEIIRK